MSQLLAIEDPRAKGIKNFVVRQQEDLAKHTEEELYANWVKNRQAQYLPAYQMLPPPPYEVKDASIEFSVAARP